MNKRRRGISLIVLVITILVMIILAGVVVVSLQKNNPIEKAKEATFKQSLAQIGEELEMFCINEKAQNSEFNKESLHASKNSLAFNTKTESSGKNIYDIIPSLKDSKYKNQVEVIQGMLFYRTPDKKEIPWLRELGIHYTGIVTGTVIIEGDTLVGVSPDYVNTGTLVIPNTVKKINPGAFSGCEDLNAVVLPEGITEIPDECFVNCKSLRSISIPSTVTIIGRKAFAYCDQLNNIVLPKNLITVGDIAFEGCLKLSNVIFNDKLIKIGYQAFRRTPIIKVELKEGLKIIGSQAFDSTKIVDITIPNSVTEVGTFAFGWCYNLTKCHIGENAVLGGNIIRNSPVTNLTISPNNTNYTVIDNVVYNKGVNKVLFASNTVTNVKLPNTVTKIGKDAFNDCVNMTSLYIPASVNTVETGIIMGCSKLTGLQVDSNSSYYKVDNNVLLSKNGELLIAAADVNTSYTVPATVKKIYKSAFQNCKKLTNINLNEGLDIIDNVSLSNTGITNLVIPSTVRILGQECFGNNLNLTKVELKDSDTVNKTLYLGLFTGSENLTTVTIPKSVTKIYGGVFANTPKLTTVNFDSANPNYMYEKGVIYSKDGKIAVSAITSIDKLVLRDSVEVVEVNAFINNDFKEVNLPSNVKEIREYAFCLSRNLRRVTIPASCTSIASNVFINTPNLSEIVINKTEGSILGSPWGATQGMKAVLWK